VTQIRPPRLAALGALALVALLAMPTVAFAATNPQIARTGGMSATLPILGGGVAVTVALDPAGSISGVTVGNPALAKGDSSSDFVKFATSDGKTRVTVRALGSRLSISARATTLAELVGTGTWKANVFGNGVSSASYTVGSDTSGNPTVTLGTPAPLASGVTWTASKPAARSDGKDGGRAMATAGGTFSYQGFTKRLTISVRVDKADKDDPGRASLSITLSGRDVQRLTGSLADLAGAGTRTWSGYLCDGKTKVTVAYHVAADGTIAFDSATGGTATHKSVKGGGLWVRFDGTGVGFAARLHKNSDGTYTLRAAGFSGRCARVGDGKGECASGNRSGGHDRGGHDRDRAGDRGGRGGWGGGRH